MPKVWVTPTTVVRVAVTVRTDPLSVEVHAIFPPLGRGLLPSSPLGSDGVAGVPAQLMPLNLLYA